MHKDEHNSARDMIKDHPEGPLCGSEGSNPRKCFNGLCIVF